MDVPTGRASPSMPTGRASPSRDHRLSSSVSPDQSQLFNRNEFKDDHHNQGTKARAEAKSNDSDDDNDSAIKSNKAMNKSMFTDYSAPPLTLGYHPQSPSSSSSRKTGFLGVLTTDTGTDACNLLQEVDVGVQVVISCAVEVQTDEPKLLLEEEVSVRRNGKIRRDEGKGDDDDDDDDYNDEAKDNDNNEESKTNSSFFPPLSQQTTTSLLTFLEKVSPLMLSELSSNLESQAFENYKTSADDNDNAGPIVQVYSLTFDQGKSEVRKVRGNGGGLSDFRNNNSNNNTASTLTSSSSPLTGLSVTQISWNSTGSLLVASYGLLNTTGFCNSKGYLVSWNLSSRTFHPSTPTVTMEHSSYLMCVTSHPDKPGLFCAGSFNGEVLVYDFNEDKEPLIACSKIDDYFHREPITNLCWAFDGNEKDWQLCSVSGDGKVLYWSFANKLKCPIRGIRVLKKVTRGGGSSGNDNDTAVGGTAMAAHVHNKMQHDLWVGSEGGAIIRLAARDQVPLKPAKVTSCEMKWSSNALQALHRVPLPNRDEVARKIERKAKSDKRRGVDLVAVYASKVEARLLFPATADFVYDAHVGPVNALSVSPFHRKVFASAGSDGEVRVYNALSKAPIAIFNPCNTNNSSSSSVNGGDIGGEVNDVQWSKTRAAVFAVGDSRGVVHVYNLSKDEEMPVASLKGRMLVAAASAGRDKDKDRDRGGDSGDEDDTRSPTNNNRNESNVTPMTMTSPDQHQASITSIAFNGKIRNLLAAGDANGVVHVWKLPGELSDGMKGVAEVDIFNEFVDDRSEV